MTATNGIVPNNGLLIGIRPIIEAIEAGKHIDKIFIQKGLKSEAYKELSNLIHTYKILSIHVPIEKLNRITRKNHQGVIAFAAAVEFQNLGETVTRVFEQGANPLFLILDRVTDVRNFGAICRTAECTGAQAVIIPARGSAPVNYDALKTSAGALHHLSICREHNLKETISFLQQSGVKVFAVSEKTDDLLYTNANLHEPIALIMGSEEDGVSPEYLKMCDGRLKLPMFGKIGSLNVSVAAGAVLYEIVRQRLNKETL
jgi:23S rRNA (guanosine2251-2'-O)-methyltransferase